MPGVLTRPEDVVVVILVGDLEVQVVALVPLLVAVRCGAVVVLVIGGIFVICQGVLQGLR